MKKKPFQINVAFLTDKNSNKVKGIETNFLTNLSVFGGHV